MPNLIRVFVPNFPAELTTTTLSVDDLVQRCYTAGYIKGGDKETVAHSTSGSLTMAVQPTNTMTEGALGAVEMGSGVFNDIAGQYNTPLPLTSTDVVFKNMMMAAINEAPTGATRLADASVALEDLGSQWPHDSAFIPAGEFEASFDPNEGDAWHAQELDTVINGDIDWDNFLEFS